MSHLALTSFAYPDPPHTARGSAVSTVADTALAVTQNYYSTFPFIMSFAKTLLNSSTYRSAILTVDPQTPYATTPVPRPLRSQRRATSGELTPNSIASEPARMRGGFPLSHGSTPAHTSGRHSGFMTAVVETSSSSSTSLLDHRGTTKDDAHVHRPLTHPESGSNPAAKTASGDGATPRRGW